MGIEKTGPKAAGSAGTGGHHAGMDGEESVQTGVPDRKGGFWRGFIRHWLLLVVLIATIAIQGTAFVYHRASGRVEQVPPPAEIDLGMFRFEADKAEGGQTLHAEFALHVALQEAAERVARPRLSARKFRVQQDIEELLRKAHPGDFDDPGLQELKRQLLEQIDQTLGVRAVADVIVTGLKLQREGLPRSPVTSTADIAK
ncbi:MAG: flagellar basal body-associated FliL family protein [Thermoguttaceae bacterium]|jgi:flagellar basal body-associated protein FliL